MTDSRLGAKQHCYPIHPSNHAMQKSSRQIHHLQPTGPPFQENAQGHTEIDNRPVQAGLRDFFQKAMIGAALTSGP